MTWKQQMTVRLTEEFKEDLKKAQEKHGYLGAVETIRKSVKKHANED